MWSKYLTQGKKQKQIKNHHQEAQKLGHLFSAFSTLAEYGGT
jgi:hypothetical protein